MAIVAETLFRASSRPSSVGKQPVGSGLLLSPAHRLKGPWSRLSKLLVAGRELCPLLPLGHQPLSFVLGFERQGELAGDGLGSTSGAVSQGTFKYEPSFEGPQENTQESGMTVSHVCRSYRVPCWFFGGLPSLLLTYFLSGLTFINRFSFSILFLYYFYCGAAPILG